MKPFIPWVGGKTALRPVLYRLFPHRFDRYVEVFGGSGGPSCSGEVPSGDKSRYTTI